MSQAPFFFASYKALRAGQSKTKQCVFTKERIIGCLWTYSVYSFSFLIEKLILKPVLFIKATAQCHLGLE